MAERVLISATDTADDIISKAQRRFQNYRLESAFQPIFSLSHRRAVGFETLIRARTPSNEPVSPAVLFKAAKAQSQNQLLDRICQRLHIQNFARRAPAESWLFLNIDTETITSKSYQASFLTHAMAAEQLPFHRLVVEITEGAIRDEAVLSEAVAHFRALGAQVALDDFGAGHSNFDRIWRLAPDIIKLDRSIIAEAAQHGAGKLRRMLPNLVAMMHEAGSIVLAEGVETRDQGLMALDADIDFVQGFYFARPAPRMDESWGEVAKLECLTDDFIDTAIVKDREDRRVLAPYVDMFRAVGQAMGEGLNTEQTRQACQPLLNMPRTMRCYLLDARGEQVGSLSASTPQHAPDLRCAPIADTAGAAWFRRPYFRSALNEPRRVKVSRPLLSVPDMDMCVTLSIANGQEQSRVLCCDIRW